jgi:hypothetical protein
MDGAAYAAIAISFGLAAGLIGRAKGSSVLIWFAGLIAVILFRSEHNEPERRCTSCGKILKLYVQVCPRCGTDLDYPKEGEPVRYPDG